MRSALVLCSAVLAACGPATAPCPKAQVAPAASTTLAAPAPVEAPSFPEADLVLRLRPSPSPAPLVHVEITVARAGSAVGPWRIARGKSGRIARAHAHDGAGDIAVDVADVPPGVELRLARAASEPVTLAYDVLAGDDAPDDPLAVYVVDDRFRGAGETLVALPAGIESTRGSAAVRLEGEALRAAAAASSLGVGSARRTTLAPGVLRHMSFVAGSLGVQVIDDPAFGHDEGAWLGYTAFDPRPVIAELAQVRSSFRDLLKSRADTGAWTYLFVSQTRPLGSFSATARSGSLLLQVGPSEPWSALLRLSSAQHLARRWIGGEAHPSAPAGRDAEGWWFSDGASRYLATLLLGHLGLLTPDDVRDVIVGELSVLATSPHGKLGNVRLAELAPTDEMARATLMARGALYVLYEAATIRARTKGERGVQGVLAAIVRQAEDRKETAFPLSAWLDAVGKDDPDAARTFDALMVRGDPIVLPPNALGPCFRSSTGDYTAFDPGFDVAATRASKDSAAVGVRPDGPAAKAGLKEGDAIRSLQAHEGDGDVPVKLVVTRAGADVAITYVPRGARGRGQTWSRLKHVADERCGEPL